MWTLLTWTGKYRRLAVAAGCAAVALYLGLLLWHAAARKPWNDEAVAARAGFNLSDKGHTGVEFYEEKSSGFPGANRHTYYIFPSQLPTLAVWYKLVGFSLFKTRMLSLLWTCGLLIAYFLAMRRLMGDDGIALLATALSAVDYQLMCAGSFGRYDTMVAAFGYASYAVYLGMRESRLRLALVLANACVAVAGTTHPNGIFYFAGLWMMVVYLDRKRVGWKDLAVSAIPYVIGGAIWASFILEDLPAFQGQMKRNGGGRFGFLRPWETLVAEIKVRYIAAFGLGAHSAGHDSPLVRLKALPLAAYLLGVLGCLWTPSIRGNPRYRLLLLLAGLHWVFMTFYENMKYSFYLVHLLPFYAALLAVWTASLWRSRRVPAAAIVAGLALVAAVEVGGIAMRIRLNDHDRVYLPAVQFLKSHATPSDRVFASCSLGFSYGFDGLRDDESLGFVSGETPDFVVMEEIYDGQHNIFRAEEPEKYHHVQNLLARYKLIYTGGEYRIYERPDRR